MVVDRLGALGADVVAPPAPVIAKLAAKNIPIAAVPLTDIPMGRSEGGVYSTILSELLASDHCDAVVSVVGSSSRDREIIVGRVLHANGRNRKPLAVFLAPRAEEGLALLEENGIAGFRTPETCADAVSAYLNWRAPGQREMPHAAGVAAATALARGARAARLNERDSCALFAALGIETAQSRVWSGKEAWTDPDGEVAIKILSADIPHKTDGGMVRLDVPAAVARREAERLLADAQTRFPQARIDGVLLQRMERGVAEVIVGYRRDPEVGPVVMLGAGGIAAELKRDYCVRIAPVGLEEAASMIDEVRDLAVLRGFRNLPRGDGAALVRAIHALSLLALLDERKVTEAEINPLIVRRDGRGVVAVDGLVVFADA
jgi:acetate---CoA ligase (ADP-forming)